MTELQLTLQTNNLQSWRWQNIIQIYKVYGEALQEYARLKKSIQLEWLDNGLNELSACAFDFDQHFKADVEMLNFLIHDLDLEIARRNKLIGVVG